MSDQLDIADRYEIIETCTRMGQLIDNRRWEELGEIFADSFAIDYTSVFGGTTARITPADMVTNSRLLLGRLDATQHLVAGHIVTGRGDNASCVSQVQATHVRPSTTGDPHWTVGAQYDMDLIRTPAGWRISSLKATMRWATGNREVMRLGKVRPDDNQA
jgi:SnoaL-like protein